ncbi:MAG: glycoside hydrolase family 15 protein [Beijerinckiaceae bacterium]
METSDTAPVQNALPGWMERQYRICATAMLRAISATEIIKERRAFGQTIRPARGSVLASPERASYDPNPDYFFHWLRDSALVIDALRELIEDRTLEPQALQYFNDFVEFSLALGQVDGPALLRHGDFRRAADPAFLPFARTGEELAAITGDRVLGETRFNPDGTLDIIKWSRPQHDGPALRALTLLRFWRLEPLHARMRLASMRALLERDLEFTFQHWREPCYDLWEENSGQHYHTRIVQYAALRDGAAWSEAMGEAPRAQAWRAAAQEIARSLDAHFDPVAGVYLTPAAEAPDTARLPSTMRLDISVILGVIHAGGLESAHSVLDPKILATMVRLEQLFAGEYKINRERAPYCAPAMGRYAGDKYYSGGAYYFATLGAAQFYYRFAQAAGGGATIAISGENRAILAEMLAEPPSALGGASLEPRYRAQLSKALFDLGDKFMAMVRVHTPDSGELSEQFDQADGAQTSARNLTWSYAAFVTAFASRRAAMCSSRHSIPTPPQSLALDSPASTDNPD